MKFTVIFSSAVLIMASFSTCYYDSEEYLYPQVNNACDTTNVTYSLVVKPILENNCYGCHSNTSSSLGGNVRLEDYADVMIRVSNGSLIGTVSHSSGFVPMPQGAPKLEECKITTIQLWIDDGSPNN